MKYLIAGLGNIGDDYKDTRHNIGFNVLDAFAEASNTVFTDKRYGAVAEVKYRGRMYILLKPSTFMNLSGNAVNYWLRKENIPVENLLVIVDDIALPLGSIRMRARGSDGGHNGLSHISEILGTNDYPRIRIGIGNGFHKGRQIDFVLGKWDSSEKNFLKERISIVINMIRSFGTAGVENTMNLFNKTGKITPPDKDKPGEDPLKT